MWRTALWAMASLLLEQGVAAQKPIRVDVNLVNVAFTARDAEGALVSNLTRDDVELYEDAVAQKIEFFSKSTDLPLTMALIVDVSGSQDYFGKKHEKDLQVFLKEVLGPKDRVFLVCFGNHLRLVSDYTNLPDEILESYREFDKGKRHFPEIGPEEERDLGTAFYDSIYYSVSEKLSQAGGRKAILMFSDGEDNSSSHDMMTTVEKAQAENVLVYAIR
jgi:Ca-activated chloride channel family protein